MKFEDWFHEPENFALRAERFYDDIRCYKHNEKMDETRIVEWLRAAYEAGRDRGALEELNWVRDNLFKITRPSDHNGGGNK
jgi:hypothetical protein